MRTAVFDLDGTLADTSRDLIAAANAALEEAGFGTPLDAWDDAAVAFQGGRAMLRAGLDRQPARNAASAVAEETVERLYPRLLDRYSEGICVHTKLYDGAEQAIDRLASEGWRLAVCTNKPIALANELLRRLNLANRFATVLGADSLPVHKPDPGHLFAAIDGAGGSRDAAVLIGDTQTDRETARRAGVPSILVTFGPDGAGVARLEPDALLDHFDALPGLLAEMIPLPRAAI